MNCPLDWQEPGVTCSKIVSTNDLPLDGTMPVRAVNTKQALQECVGDTVPTRTGKGYEPGEEIHVAPS